MYPEEAMLTFGACKNVQIMAQFQTTLLFSFKYLQNILISTCTIEKQGEVTDDRISSKSDEKK